MKKTNDNSIFLHKLFKAIADSIIKLFIPLYIVKQTGNVNLSLYYLTIYSLFVFVLMVILKKFIQKYGVIAIILHFIPIVATEAILSFCEINYLFVTISALLMALTQTLYSIPLNLIFSFGDKKVNVAKFQISTNVGKLIFTLISGYVLSSTIKNSFLILSIASTIMYIICIIPIISSYGVLIEKYNASNKSSGTQLSKNKLFTIFHISFGCFQTTIDNVVPIFLYVNQLSFKAITTLIALIELLKIFANYLAKYLVKIDKRNVSCYISASMYFLSLVGIIFIKNNIVLYILSCVCSICFPLTFVPMFKLFCEKIREENCTIYQMTKRDLDIFSLRPVYYGAYFLGIGFYSYFVFGMISVITMAVCETKLLRKKTLPSPNLQQTKEINN